MKYLIPLILGLSMALFSCAGGDDSAQSQAKTTPKPAPKAEAVDSPGKKVYNTHCVTCHLPTGKGISGIYPPLIKTKWVSGDNATLIQTVLNGMKGEIEVLGETYNNVMTPYKDVLNDQEIADVLTYVRSSFGNDYPAITAAEVKAERAKL